MEYDEMGTQVQYNRRVINKYTRWAVLKKGYVNVMI